MKKINLALAFLIVSSVAGYSQGLIAFHNTASFLTSPPDRLVHFQDVPNYTNGAGVKNGFGEAYVAQLFFASDAGNPNAPAAVVEAPANFRGPTTTLSGTWLGGDRTLNGVSSGQATTLIVRVWDSGVFGSYGAAVSGGGVVGQSAPFSYTVPASPTAPPEQFVMANYVGFNISPVPEPSTIALGAIGALGLVLLRRKK